MNSSPKSQLSVLDELRPKNIFASVSAGFISGMITTIFTISLVGLIFSGQLTEFIPLGVGWFLAGAVVLGLWNALASSYSGNISSPQGKPAVVLALSATALATQVSSENVLATVCMLMVATSLLTGAVLYALGHFRLGNLTRFLPYPVIGGFQVGTGWLIIVGSFSVLTGHKLSFENLELLMGGEMIWRWLPALIFAVLMLVIMRYRAHFLTLSGMLLGGVILFHLVVWSQGESLDELRTNGWLLGPFPSGGLWQFPSFSGIDWGAISSQTPTILIAVFLIASDVLLVSVAIEISTYQRLDLDQELKATGLANFAAAWVGGLPGYNAISLVLLNHKVGASNRLTAVVSAVVCVLFLLWGIPLLDYFPVMVLGGLLFFLGMAFMREWVWDAWSRLSLVDYLLIIAIWILIAFLGFIQGVSAGLLVAMVIFIVNYSRIKVIKLQFSGQQMRSNRERPPEENVILDRLGHHIKVFKLQGFIFFGTANNLLEQYRELFEDSETEARFVIFDFRAITGIDSSAVASFRQMIQLSTSKNSNLLFADVPEAVARILDSNDLRQGTKDALGEAPHLDHCLEWCEEKLLSEKRSLLVERSFATVLAEIFTADEIERFRATLDRRELKAGEVLCEEGAPSDSLFFIEHGQVAASVKDLDGVEERLRSLGSGAIIGEMGLYTEAPRSATLTALEATTLFVLTRETLEQLQRDDPVLATTFHCYIARILADRLGQANNTLKFLLK